MPKKKILRRGFVKEAEEYAELYRGELGLKPHSPLCPWQLARHLGVVLIALSELQKVSPEAVAHFRGAGSSKLSAMVVHLGTSSCIVYNDCHLVQRHASSIAHELAHIILGHPPRAPLDGEGKRNSDSTLEEEANRLGFTLLIPKPAAMYIIQSSLPLFEAAEKYGVSEVAVKMRMNQSGAKAHAKRLQNFRRSRGWA